jgi:hypothetical protein
VQADHHIATTMALTELRQHLVGQLQYRWWPQVADKVLIIPQAALQKPQAAAAAAVRGTTAAQKPSMQAATALLDRATQADLEFTTTELLLEHITAAAAAVALALMDTISITEVLRHEVAKVWHQVLAAQRYTEQAVVQAVIMLLATDQQV